MNYNDLIAYLSEDYHVIPFPYDWRMSIEKEAERLATEVKKVLEQTPRDKKVSFLAHSMGGLLVRKMIQEEPELWQKIIERTGR